MSGRANRWASYGADTCRAAIVVHGMDTSVLWANQTAAELLGMTVDDLTGKVATDPSFRLLDADGSPLPVERFPIVEALRDGTFVTERVVGAERADRRPVYGRLTVQPVVEDGEQVAVVITFVDDTDLIDTQGDLAELRARYQRAVEGTRDGLWEVDLQSGGAWFAPRFVEILGLAAGSLDSVADWAAYLHPEDHEAVVALWNTHLEDGTPYDIQYRLRHRDGSWRHVHARGRAERDASGRPLRFSGAISDVTPRVELAAERDALRARAQAAARVESLAVLAGGVAHDFNNLLTGLLGAADSARTTPGVPRDIVEDMELVIQSAERAARLTRQLMAYAGATPLDVDVVAVEPMVQGVARVVRAAMPAGTRLLTSLTGDAPSVRADPTQLHQALMNLLLNASEAIEPGGSVRVRSYVADRSDDDLAAVHSGYGQAGRYAVVEVTDDGVGMSEETVTHLFEPFYTTKRTGHGLGLSSLHGMVRSHAGYVDVRSTPGQGSTFELGLPAVDAPPSPLRRTPEPPLSRIGTGRVALVVDDEDMVRAVLRRMLEREGFKVHERSDGADLESAVADLQPHLVVLDVLLPGRSGLDLLQALRQSGDARPVLLSSGHARTEQHLPELDRAVRFLPKPYRLRTLRAYLADLLQQEP